MKSRNDIIQYIQTKQSSGEALGFLDIASLAWDNLSLEESRELYWDLDEMKKFQEAWGRIINPVNALSSGKDAINTARKENNQRKDQAKTSMFVTGTIALASVAVLALFLLIPVVPAFLVGSAVLVFSIATIAAVISSVVYAIHPEKEKRKDVTIVNLPDYTKAVSTGKIFSAFSDTAPKVYEDPLQQRQPHQRGAVQKKMTEKYGKPGNTAGNTSATPVGQNNQKNNGNFLSRWFK